MKAPCGEGVALLHIKEKGSMRSLVLVAILTLALACAAFSADINGKWKGTFEGGMGGEPIEQNFTFKVDGQSITGTFTDMMFPDAKITKGTLKGEDIEFTVTGASQMGGEMSLNFKGKITGADEMKLTFAMAGGGMGGPGGPGAGGEGGMPPMQVTIKRVK
jgi:opacity protein-like surface antigen